MYVHRLHDITYIFTGYLIPIVCALLDIVWSRGQQFLKRCTGEETEWCVQVDQRAVQAKHH